MASCSSSLAVSRGHPLCFHAARPERIDFRPQAVPCRNGLGFKLTASKPLFTRKTVVALATESGDSTADGSDSAVQPSRKKKRSKKAKISKGSSGGHEEGTDEEELEGWDFFGELEELIAKGGPELNEPGGVMSEPGISDVGITMRSTNINIPLSPRITLGTGAASRSIGGRRGSKERNSREQNKSADINKDDDDIDWDNPKYQQKPDWMHKEVWQSFLEQKAEEDDEETPLWMEEEDPSWPDEADDGWGFRTSQFFDKVTIKNNSTDEDNDDVDDEDKIDWEAEMDDGIIKEIITAEWEMHVFATPSPLVVYVFARYGPRSLDSWKTLAELQKAVTSIWESAKAPLRAVKIDVGLEVDLGTALNIKPDDCPQILFIKNGKGLYKLEEKRTSEELVQLITHLFYNGAQPSFLNSTRSSAVNVKGLSW